MTDTSQDIVALPGWAQDLRRRYLAGESAQFLLHGNVHDLVPWRSGFVPLRTFLAEGLLAAKELVVFYDPSEGLTFAQPEMKRRFLQQRATLALADGEVFEPAELPTAAAQVLPLLERFLLAPGSRLALVIDFAEAIAPAADLAMLSADDRVCVLTLQRWAKDARILGGDNLILLVSEHVADLNRRVAGSPQLAQLVIPRPPEADRCALIARRRSEGAFESVLDDATLARITSGLRFIQIDNMFRMARQSALPVDFALVSQRRKEVIEAECQGLVELMEAPHGLDAVGGLEEPKGVLLAAARAIREGQTQQVPMGVMLVGPMGTGKSFLAAAFARESGLTCLVLKNFREKWVGSTEANLQKILGLIQTMGSVMVVVDEVERAFGGEDGDSGTSSRVFATLKAFMADTRQRGRVLWLVMTNRPDKLDVDLKRPGRFDLKIPLFFPHHREARRALVEALVRKNRLRCATTDALEPLSLLEGYSGAELEAVLLIAARFAALEAREEITRSDADAACRDYIPHRDRDMIAFMELLAIFECSSRRLLPPLYRDLETSELQARLTALQQRLRLT
ncbi:MAG: ATP-binding protein [Candidatus Sericytochromatia bacterium]|nr:ATP-binding protein [Candidatus Sericytochromatia bacterium]